MSIAPSLNDGRRSRPSNPSLNTGNQKHDSDVVLILFDARLDVCESSAMSIDTEHRIAELQARLRAANALRPALKPTGTEPRTGDKVRHTAGLGRAGRVTDVSGFTVTIATTGGALVVESVSAFRSGAWRVEA